MHKSPPTISIEEGGDELLLDNLELNHLHSFKLFLNFVPCITLHLIMYLLVGT